MFDWKEAFAALFAFIGAVFFVMIAISIFVLMVAFLGPVIGGLLFVALMAFVLGGML
jgi:hypothetical protein